MSLKAKFGKKIKYLRESLFLTQEQLAEKINIHRNTLARIESGENFATAETIDNLKNALGANYPDLFDFGESLENSQNLQKALQVRLNTLSEADLEYFIASIDAYLEAKKRFLDSERKK